MRRRARLLLLRWFDPLALRKRWRPLPRRDGRRIADMLPPSPASASGFVRHYAGVLVPDSLLAAVEDPAQLVFDRFVWEPVAQGTYESPGTTLSKAASVRIEATTGGAIGPGEAGVFAPRIQVRYGQSASDPAMWSSDGTPMWASDTTTPMWIGITDWIDWTRNTVITAYFQARFICDFSKGLPIVTHFIPTAAQPNLSDGGNGVAAAAGGSRINFVQTAFLNPPFVTASAVSVLSGSLGWATAQNIDANGFTLHVFNAAGSDVGGTANWMAHN